MSGASRLLSVLIDGRVVKAEPGQMLLPVARAAGVQIPSLCHVDGIDPLASCRLCLVELTAGSRTRIVTSCDLPVTDGMRVSTDSSRVRKLRGSVMALHLAQAPGAPELEALARSMGVQASGALRSASPVERCILCGLCTGICSQVVGAHAIGNAGRGTSRRVTLPYEEMGAPDCIGCGACSWVCPTRCIEIEPMAIERLRQRWGQERPCRYALMGLIPGSVCPHDYRCSTCQVDHEMFELAGGRHPVFLRESGHGGEP